MREFAFVEHSPGRVFIGWGPFTEAPVRFRSRPAFYLPDYFLDNPNPWKHPEFCEEIPLSELLERVLGKAWLASPQPRFSWDALDEAGYERLFLSAQSALSGGEFQKIVPVLFEEGQLLSDPASFWAWLLSRVALLPQGLRAYGYFMNGRGLVGASPETLLAKKGETFETMALAGTRPLALKHELLEDPKELAEHEMVVRDIHRRLRVFGEVSVGETRLLELPRLAHLHTPLRMTTMESNPALFGELVRWLHPTAALGAWPRNGAAERWLREADTRITRDSFGAPFGFENERGDAFCLVAIRNIMCEGARVRIGSGGGLLPESVLRKEWKELRNKREQVKGIFGIA